MTAAIASGEVDLMPPSANRSGARSSCPKRWKTWPLDVIEEALGAEADAILPQAIRTAELRVRLPRHIAMLHYKAEQHQTTVNHALARELDAIASAEAPELSAAIPGFAAALAWPDAEHAQLPC